MKIQWTSHLKEDEDKDKFKQSIRAARPVLGRLAFLLEERKKAIESIETGVEKYSHAGWSAIQAHYNGEKATLKYILNLIDLDQEA